MSDKKQKLHIHQIDTRLNAISKHSRRREIARRQAMTWKNGFAEEELERLLEHESFVENLMKEYMRHELRDIAGLVYEIEDESERQEQRWKIETLLDDLKRLLPDLIDMME